MVLRQKDYCVTLHNVVLYYSIVPFFTFFNLNAFKNAFQFDLQWTYNVYVKMSVEEPRPHGHRIPIPNCPDIWESTILIDMFISSARLASYFHPCRP